MNRNIRLLFISFFIIAYFIVISFVLLNKSLLNNYDSNHAIFNNHQTIKLPKVYDRNGFLLSTTLPTASIYANTKKISNPKDIAKKLNNVFPYLSEQSFYKKLTSGEQFVWIKKHLTPKEQLDFLYLGIPGIYVQNDSRRIYITENLFSHVLGYVNSDNVGIAGFEYYLSKLQSNSDSVNSNSVNSDNVKNSFDDNIRLTVDTRIQHILRSEIQNSITRYNAIGGAGIILDANTGEIIAMTSLPDFNPNHQQFASDSEKFNRTSLGVYEFGSIMKLFTVAAALDTESISMNDEFDVSSPISIDKYIIKDFHKPKKPIYTVNDVLWQSSNIGMAKIVLRTGAQIQKEYYKKLKFLDRLKIQAPEKGNSIAPKKYDELTAITISYGYGFSTSLLHVAQAMTALVNNSGVVNYATLLKSDNHHNNNHNNSYHNNHDSDHDSNHDNVEEKVIDDSTRKILRELLLEVVNNGTGRRAKSKEYNIGGKTGSAEKSQNGVYNKKLNIASFIAAVPMEKPKYIIAVMIDEPKGEGTTTGGIVAAPVVKKVVERMGPLLL